MSCTVLAAAAAITAVRTPLKEDVMHIPDGTVGGTQGNTHTSTDPKKK